MRIKPIVFIVPLLLLALAATGLLVAQSGSLGFADWPLTLPGIAIQPTEVVTESTPMEMATALPPPTEIATPEASPLPAPSQGRWELEIAVLEGNLLVLLNLSGQPFPLPLLRLGEGERAIEGSEWRVERVGAGQCVVAVKLTGRPAVEEPPCQIVGQRVERQPNEVLWNSDFAVYFEGRAVGTCDKEGCVFQIP